MASVHSLQQPAGMRTRFAASSTRAGAASPARATASGVGAARRAAAALRPTRAACRLRVAVARSSTSPSTRGPLRVVASEATEAMDEAMKLYKDGVRGLALRRLEQVNMDNCTDEEQARVLFNMLCCHTSQGDLESAQICLRGLIGKGMDYEEALTDPTLIKMESSPQVRIQLKKFAQTYKNMPKDARPTDKATRPIADPSRPGFKPSSANPLDDVEGIGIDTSIKAVATRVGIVLVVVVVSFVGLFYAGLSTFQN